MPVVVSLLVVSAGVVDVLSVVAGALIEAESVAVLVLSELPLADFWELQPAAIEPMIIAVMAKVKTCFFISFV